MASSSSSSSSSSYSSSSSSLSTLAIPGGLAFGEQNPTQDEAPESWQTWSDGSAGLPVIIDNPDWGQLQLTFNVEGRSKVYAFDSDIEKRFTLTTNRYQTGQGTAIPQIRGSASIFSQDDNIIAWTNYTGTLHTDWRFIQIRIIKS